jgi:hypothetical protein
MAALDPENMLPEILKKAEDALMKRVAKQKEVRRAFGGVGCRRVARWMT